MWRIGQLAQLAGVSERTLRHYDAIGLLRPLSVDAVTGYRWYGVAQLAQLERVRAMREAGLPLRQIMELTDAPDVEVRQALESTVDELRQRIADLTAKTSYAQMFLDGSSTLMPRIGIAAARRLRVRRHAVSHPAELATVCGDSPGLLLTWLTGIPEAAFAAATADPRGEPLTLPRRTVVRVLVPPAVGLVQAGKELFGWLAQRDLTMAGPALEERFADGTGARATVLELTVRGAHGVEMLPKVSSAQRLR